MKHHTVIPNLAKGEQKSVSADWRWNMLSFTSLKTSVRLWHMFPWGFISWHAQLTTYHELHMVCVLNYSPGSSANSEASHSAPFIIFRGFTSPKLFHASCDMFSIKKPFEEKEVCLLSGKGHKKQAEGWLCLLTDRAEMKGLRKMVEIVGCCLICSLQKAWDEGMNFIPLFSSLLSL